MYGLEIEFGSYKFNYDEEDEANEFIEENFTPCLSNFWEYKADGSVGVGHVGLESCSIKSDLDDLESETLKYTAFLEANEFKTDDGDSAGIHIHIGMEAYTYTSCLAVREMITRLDLEEDDGYWADVFGREDGDYHYGDIHDSPDHKFQRCSIRRGFNTIEVRAFASTFDHDKLRQYFKFIRFCTSLLEQNITDGHYDMKENFQKFEVGVCA